MFEGKLCKKAARAQLHGRWKGPVLLTLVIALICICLSLPVMLIDSYTHPSGMELAIRQIASIIFFCVQAAISLAACSYVLFIARTPGPVNLNPFFKGLEKWWKAIRAQIWFNLWTFLWSLLFIIPGIIKAIAYSQIFFILADHPKVGVLKAMKMSKLMTNGYKGDIFLLDLSFIGWALLSLLTCGIGFLWLAPYMYQTYANVYRDLQNRALKSGILTPEDFE